ncbi:hypothetical protein O3Q52_01735 [Streptomyces sp. ActVer]|uniref:hypothetical protein n=1 Tax=Streptomyces sp. ActVer TaxID=3014558 RepID=UPI0022B542BA|nr:hypothetical protein [Streptomyces sp. ActVer]MCZ4506949.1 hypothetical protein [Streptomyces sp. ActVer]
MKVFGREPVYILATIAVALKLSAAYGFNISDAEQGALMAFLSFVVAVINAFVLKTGAAGAAIVNLAQGGIALFLAFGLEMPAETQALWMFVVEAVVALVIHKEVTAPVPELPIETASPVKAA